MAKACPRIDWRRSARDDHTYVRDREWEAAHTIWLWADLSPSMMYKSKFGSVSKESRALVLMLALAEILARSGERIGCPGVMEPVSARNAAERLATALMHTPLSGGLPQTQMIRGASDLVLIGDFLDPADTIMAQLGPLARRGLRGHVIEIADPAEESFPYAGRTEFTDPENRRETGRPGAPRLSATTIAAPISQGATAWAKTCAISAGRLRRTVPTISPPKRWWPCICICPACPDAPPMEASCELPAVHLRQSADAGGPRCTSGHLVAVAHGRRQSRSRKFFRRCAFWPAC